MCFIYLYDKPMLLGNEKAATVLRLFFIVNMLLNSYIWDCSLKVAVPIFARKEQGISLKNAFNMSFSKLLISFDCINPRKWSFNTVL